MDMRSKDILKDALQKFDGTVVVVSHDREFLDGLVDRIYEFRDGGVREYLGDIWYFLEKRKVESLQEIERKDRPTQSEKSNDTPTAGKMTYEQKKEQEKILRKLRKAVESVEEELAKVESEIAEYDKRFAVATEYNAEDYAKYDTLKQHYDHLMHEWEKASYELEITEQN
jgi:ATP-binding cassette subfamily F protein 3